MKQRRTRVVIGVLLALLISSFVVLSQQNDTRIRWINVEGAPGGNFYMSATEVTFAQYDAFCDATGYQKPNADFGRGNQPVINVNIDDAFAYCKWLSKETGSLVRLPDANEWEYAAKGGSEGDHYVFSGSGNPQEVAWFVENSEEDEYSPDVELPNPRTHIVATKQPNLLGLYDMSGNVWEWCDTLGYAMGGSFLSNGQSCFPYSKSDQADPKLRDNNLGFRVLMKK